MTAINLLVFALIGAGGQGRYLVIERRRLVSAATSILASVVVAAGLAWLLLFATVDTTYRSAEKLFGTRRALSATHERRHRASRPAGARDPGSWGRRPRPRTGEGPRGTLRIGYDPDNIPFSFFNADQQLVGFDIELAQNLAESLGLKAEFVPVTWPDMPAMLAERRDRRDAGHLGPPVLVLHDSACPRRTSRARSALSCATSAGTSSPDVAGAAARARPEGRRAPRRDPAGGQPAAVLRRQPAWTFVTFGSRRGLSSRSSRRDDRRLSDARRRARPRSRCCTRNSRSSCRSRTR